MLDKHRQIPFILKQIIFTFTRQLPNIPSQWLRSNMSAVPVHSSNNVDPKKMLTPKNVTKKNVDPKKCWPQKIDQKNWLSSTDMFRNDAAMSCFIYPPHPLLTQLAWIMRASLLQAFQTLFQHFLPSQDICIGIATQNSFLEIWSEQSFSEIII